MSQVLPSLDLFKQVLNKLCSNHPVGQRAPHRAAATAPTKHLKRPTDILGVDVVIAVHIAPNASPPPQPTLRARAPAIFYQVIV
jgi:hypothetical protein